MYCELFGPPVAPNTAWRPAVAAAAAAVHVRPHAAGHSRPLMMHAALQIDRASA